MIIPPRFFIGLIVGLLLGVTVFVRLLYVQLGVPTESSQWVTDLHRKKGLLAANVSGPRLLLVGGSATLFGINAQLIQQQTGWPTINIGTYAGLYTDYLLYRIEKIARPGDLILLTWEYELYSKSWRDSMFDDFILARDPEFFHHLSLLSKIDMATRIPFARIQEGWINHQTSMQVKAPTPPYSPYTPISSSIDCLDGNGDEIFNPQAAQPPATSEMRTALAILTDGTISRTDEGFKLLAAFITWARNHQVTVLATFPNIVYKSDYDGPAAQNAIATIVRFYSSHNVPIIGTAREAMLPLNQFFDTKYHLTYEAGLERTRRLIPELKPYLHAH